MAKQTKAEFHSNPFLWNGLDRRVESLTGMLPGAARPGTHLYRKTEKVFPRGGRRGQKGAYKRLLRNE